MERIGKFLKERKEKGLFRTLQPASHRKEGKIYIKNKEYIDFSSNDYLGLSDHPAIKEASRKTTEKYGTGSSASRLLSGNFQIHHELEEKIASFKGTQAGLVFNSGYQANIGLISAICQKGDAIFADRLSHASIIDGILLSGAKLFRFRHNDMNHLESLLKKERTKFHEALIITESVFSMDGDRAPLEEIAELKKRYNCKLMIDEAHATGVFREREADADLLMGTFSKALGSFGAYVCCSSQMKEYLINTARSFIYSTALPPGVIAANLASLEVAGKESFRSKALLENSDYLRAQLIKKGFNVKGSSQIIPLILGDNDKTVKVARALQDRGYWVLPIRTPTVPRGEARLRFSLTYHHKKDMLEELLGDV